MDIPGNAAALWRTMLVCVIAQNVAMGFAFGSFGPLLSANQAHFDVTRAMAAMGMSLITLSLGLVSPLAGGLLGRIGARSAMIVGAVLSAIGYLGLSATDYYPLALLLYALIGAGVSLTAILGPVTLVTRWVTERRGRMLSIVNLPLVLFACPFAVAFALPMIGRTGVFLTIGAIFVILVPLLLLIVERPIETVQTLRVGSAPMVAVEASVFRSPAFWGVCLGVGILAGTGTAFVVHIVPFGVSRGLSLTEASVIQSTYSAAGIFGVLMFGWLADKIGPAPALVLDAACQALLWWIIVGTGEAGLYPAAALLGMCSVPLITLHGAVLGALFGGDRVSAAMGLSFAIKLPFLFCAPPLVGYLSQQTGSYALPFLICAATLAVAAMLFLLVMFADGRLRPAWSRLATGW